MDPDVQAGASAVDALRSIIISEQLLGTTEIVLVKHTGCGMLTFTNNDAYGIVEKQLGSVVPGLASRLLGPICPAAFPLQALQYSRVSY